MKDKPIKLNLGCGYNHIKSYINIDINLKVNPDMCFDILNGLPFDDDSIDEIRAYDFLEHIPIGKTIQVVEEIYRVLKPNGKFEHLTPSTDGRGAFQDPTHLSFWNINSWIYYMNDEYRKLYGIKAKFTGEIRDIITSNYLNIIHTHGVLYAVKDIKENKNTFKILH